MLQRQRGLSRRRVAIAAATALGLVAVLAVIARVAGDRVTTANFAKIRIGMSQADLRELLGAPEFAFRELGLVDANGYTTNSSQSAQERRERGFQVYLRQQWASREITISVISDADGLVVGRYSGPGQQTSWLLSVFPWLSRFGR